MPQPSPSSSAPRSLRRVVASWAVVLALAVSLAACQQRTVAPRGAPVQASPPAELIPPTPGPTGPGIAAPPPGAQTPPAGPGPGAPPEVVPREPGLPPGPVSVALLLPLSGPSAALGRAMLDAAQLALFDVGVDKFVLLPKDTAGLPDGAARAAEAAIRDGASLILGPLFSGSVGAVVPLAEAAGIKVIAFSSDRNAARPGVYLMGFLPDQQVERVVGFARERGYGRFAALAPASHYGETVVRELRRVAQATGAELVDSVFYPADVRAASDVSDIIRVFADFDARRQRLLAQRRALEARDDEVSREALRRLEGLDTLGDLAYDAVLLPEGGLRLLTVAPLLPYYDAGRDKVRLLGTAQWETAALDQEPALVGGWYAAPPPEARRGFESRFAELFGHAPPRLATLAYDAVALAGALARLPDGPDFSAETLTNAGGFRGLDGLFRFAPDGTNERGLAVLEVTARGVVTVSPAPRSFAAF